MLGVFEAVVIWSAGEQRSVCKSLKQTWVDSGKKKLQTKRTKSNEKNWKKCAEQVGGQFGAMFG